MRTLIRGAVRPAAGDLVLARVDELGKQTKIELTDGRRAHLFPGDEIVVSFGNRYAPDQYEAVIGPDLSPCDLIAAGGVAANELSRHQRMPAPTRITPIGLIGDVAGRRLNLMQFRVEAGDELPAIPAVLSLGTSMNAGKTLSATAMVRGLKREGLKVAALKITGTGAGGDMWIVRDAGADIALDFTDAGFATTYLAPIHDLERATYRLLNYAAGLGCEIAVIEVADGLQQLETGQLILSDAIRRIALGTVFAAYDAMGAKCGVDLLRDANHAVLAISGRLGRSPLAVREAESATGLRVYSPYDLQNGVLVPAIRARAAERYAERYAESGFREHRLSRIARAELHTARAVSIDARGLAADLPAGEHDAARTVNVHVLRLPQAALSDAERGREVLRRVLAFTMRTEVDRICGAPFGKRGAGRTDRRNGCRDATWATAIGAVPIRIPRVRRGGYHPAFLRRSDEPGQPSLCELVQEVLDAAGEAALRAALSSLVARLGCEPPEAPEMVRLVSEVRGLSAGGAMATRDHDRDEEAVMLAATPPPLEPLAEDEDLEAEDDDVSAVAMF